MRGGAPGARRLLPNRPVVRLTRTRYHELSAYGSPGQHRSTQTRRRQPVEYLSKTRGSRQEDLLRLSEHPRHLQGSAWDSKRLLGAKRYQGTGSVMWTTTRPDLRSTHRSLAGVRHGALLRRMNFPKTRLIAPPAPANSSSSRVPEIPYISRRSSFNQRNEKVTSCHSALRDWLHMSC